jgi:hypothetical protein
MNSLTHFKKTPILPLLFVLALVAPQVARAHAVTDWNAIAATSIISIAGQPPHAAVISLAMVQGAVYDAVNAIDRGYQPYLVQPPSNPTDSKDAAAATAAYRVLVGFLDLAGLFPGQQPTLQPIYDNYIATLPDDPPGSKANGIAIGEVTARGCSSTDKTTDVSDRPRRSIRQRLVFGVRRHLTSGSTPPRGSGMCDRSLSRAQKCFAPTGQTR